MDQSYKSLSEIEKYPNHLENLIIKLENDEIDKVKLISIQFGIESIA